MNAKQLSFLSAQRRGGSPEDYLAIHTFLDSAQEIVSDERHRFMHTWWCVRYLVIPQFGFMIVNSEGQAVSVKHICEEDHFLPNYGDKYIPDLLDFAESITDDEEDLLRLRRFHKNFAMDEAVSTLLISPLTVTGKIKSLFFTHNSWFVNSILPKIIGTKYDIKDADISPAHFINRMKVESWMKGEAYPPNSFGYKSTYLLTA